MSDQWEIPPGKAAGLLPRDSQYGKLEGCEKFEDRFPIIPMRDWEEVSREHPVDLRQHVRHVFDQDGVGSCAAESCCGAKAIVDVAAGKQFTLYNPWALYHFTSGGRDGGSTLDANLRIAKEVGLCPESSWPREEGWRQKPPQNVLDEAQDHRIDEFFDIGSLAEFGTALLLGFPVAYGRRAHAITAVRLVPRGNGRFEIEYQNSWHPSWGDDGFGRDSAESVNYGYGSFAYRTTISHGIGEQPPEPQ